MRRCTRKILLVATTILAFSEFAAVAAPVTKDDPAGDQQTKTATKHKPNPVLARNKAGTVEQRIAELHSQLQITPEQQPQWDQFAQVMRDNAKTMDDTFKARMKTMPTMTAPENMESYAQVTVDHARDVQNLVPPFKTLYATMSDNQKHIADEMFRADPSRPRRS
jgi:periplasmic protein CpxP/Spy